MPIPTWPHPFRRRAILGLMVAVVTVAFAAVATEALVRARLDPHQMAAGTRFYARPIVLRPGTPVETGMLRRYFTRMGYRETRRRTVEVAQYRIDGDTWTIGRRGFRVADQLDTAGVFTVRLWGDVVYALKDTDGNWLSQLVLEPEPLRSAGPPGEDRVPVRLADVPDDLVQAILAVEDQRFFQHTGIDFARVIGAALADLRAGEFVEGGSTITQQLAKNLFLSARRSPIRKIREMAMAVALEARYSKREILQAYLNEVYLGQQGAFAIHGIGRAAQFYFGKDVSRLDIAESALLAGLIRGPNLYSPFRAPNLARDRRNLVLRIMRDRGLVTDASYDRAVRARLGVRRAPPPSRAGRYFTDFVARQLTADRETRAVFTTLDMDWQLAAESAVEDGLGRLEREHPRLRRTGDDRLQAALVALDPWNGDILAMVGGRDYGSTQFNRAADAHRQPGSAFKPVAALAALQSRTVTLASLLADEPLSVPTSSGTWEPVDYDGRFRGAVTLRQALESSLNVPFARLGLLIGPDRIAATARTLGVESRLDPVPALALGASEVTPLELTRAFGTLAAQGFRAEPRAILGVISVDGKLSQGQEIAGEHVIDPAAAYLVTSALEGAVERGTGRAVRAYGYDGPVAAKSGTTNDFRDAWFVGYTPSIVVGVWVGFDDGRSLELPGSRAALPIFSRFLATVRRRLSDAQFPTPPGVEVVSIDPGTGLAVGWGCGGEPEYFLTGTAPAVSDDCSGFDRIPSWVADAGRGLLDGVRALFGKLFGRDRPEP